jgi:hypothetical protein
MAMLRETMLPGLFRRGLGRWQGLRAAILGAIATERARAENESAREAEKEILDLLPDPPHLETGEVKYGTGLHDYF